MSPYVPKPNTVSMTTEPDVGNVVWVVAQSGDASSGDPVVVHKVMP